MPFLGSKEVILFQGDSVTDCGRDRDDIESMGTGYPNIAASLLCARHLDKELVFFNRGVSGNRTCDLVNRWDEDCIKLQPTIVSVLIGINDTWRRYDSNDPTSAEAFEANYRNILSKTANETKAKIILLEPFVLPVSKEQAYWREDLDIKINVVRKLALEFGARYIPFDGLFAAAYMRKAPAYWAWDGVHPTAAGHAFMADAWINAVEH